MTPSHPSPAQVRKNRWTLIILLSTFVIPFVIGHFAYTRGWYQGGQTNHGHLLTPPLDISALQLQDGPAVFDTQRLNGKWSLLYVMPSGCAQQCQQGLAHLRQVWRASGRDMERIQIVVVAPQTDVPVVTALQPGEILLQVAQVQLSSLLQRGQLSTGPGASFIMDPRGTIMLVYPLPRDSQEALLQGEGMLMDLKKMLKVSRIG